MSACRPDGAANASTQMIGRISPAGLNPWLADQGFGISRSTPGKRTVERLEDEAEATATRLRWTRGAGSRPGVAKTDDTLKGPQAIGSTALGAVFPSNSTGTVLRSIVGPLDIRPYIRGAAP